MRKLFALGVIFLSLAGSAQARRGAAHPESAHRQAAHRPRAHRQKAHRRTAHRRTHAPRRSNAQATCPAGLAVQALSVADQSGIPSPILARVENAVVAQSLQLHAAWGTPCVQFAASGWPITVTPGTFAPGCPDDPCAAYHTATPTGPSAVVTSGQGFSQLFSHEILEMLVDPYGTNGINGRLVEVCDPVEDSAGYQLDGVTVADFVLPAWYQSASAGPWDEVGLLPGAGVALTAGF
jgi:hypothetical protein